MFVVIGTKFDATGINETIDKAKDLEKKVSDIASGFKIVGTALVGFAAAGVGLMVTLTKAAAENELAQIELAGAMKKAGTYTEEAYKHALDYSDALQLITLYTDEEINTAQKLFTNFGIEGVMLDKLTKATLDFATAKGVDLASASFLVAKSIGSSTNALARYGIEIIGAEKSTTRMESAVNGITKLFGGAAETKAKSFTGKIEIMKHRIDELKERIGEYLIPKIEKLLKWVDKVIDYFENLSPATKKTIANFLLWGTAISGLSGGLLIFIGFIPKIVTGLTMVTGAFNTVLAATSPVTLAVIALTTAVGIYLAYKNNQINAANEIAGAKLKQQESIEGIIQSLKDENKEIYAQEIAGKITHEEAIKRIDQRNVAILYYRKQLDEQKTKEKEVTDATAVNTETELTLYEKAKTTKIAYTKDIYDYMVSTNQLTLKEQKSILEEQLAIVEKGTTDELELRKKLWSVNQELAKTSFTSIKDGWNYAVDQMKLKQTGWGDAFVGIIDAMESGISTALEGMLDGTKTFKESMESLWDGIKKAILKTITDLLAQAVVKQFLNFLTSSKTAPSIIAAKSIAISASAQNYNDNILPYQQGENYPISTDLEDAYNFITDTIDRIFGKKPKIHLAQGIRNFAGGLALVGEAGAELVNLPRGSNVFSAPETRQILEQSTSNSYGGNTNITVHLDNISNRRQAKYLGELVGNEILNKLKRNRKL